MSSSWLQHLERRISRWRARGLAGTWVVAVSGGGDSVGLLRALHELAPRAGLRLSVAHLDHGARGEASQADATFTAELAARLGLESDLGAWRPTRAGHFESDARRARYEWLTRIAQTRTAGVVAVAHTRDDQAETILHRILRGTGPRGLAGIPTVRELAAHPKVLLLRPLLEVSRGAIRAYLETLSQPFREDETNTDLGRTRARIRHALLPRLAAEYNPRVAESLVRLGRLAAESHGAVQSDAREIAADCVIASSPEGIVLKHGFMRSLPAFLRAEVLRHIWRSVGWPQAGMTARRWRKLARAVLADEIRPFEIGQGVTVATETHFLVLRRRRAPQTVASVSAPGEAIALDIPGSAVVPWAGGRVVATLDPEAPRDESIDLARLKPPLSIRTPVPADRFEPLGMSGRGMPLADFLRGRRIPPGRRPHTALVCDQLGIVWVVGHRIADRAKITEQTSRVLGLRWESTQ
jgi:tRNA(Ile)-lysidine synthase